MLVLDCAYEPLRLERRAGADCRRNCKRVWQLWTPNKALGLTGVRAAYAIAPRGRRRGRRPARPASPSWPVGAHGVACCKPGPSPACRPGWPHSLDTLRDWKARQITLCESLGWTCLPSDANFFCARPACPKAELPQALDRLRGHGIKLRDTASFGLPGHVRLSVLAAAGAGRAAQCVATTYIKANQ